MKSSTMKAKMEELGLEAKLVEVKGKTTRTQDLILLTIALTLGAMLNSGVWKRNKVAV